MTGRSRGRQRPAAGGTKVAVKRRPAGKRFAWPRKLLRKLGKIPDHEIARRAGVMPRTVAEERRRRGIAAYRVCNRGAEWTPEMLAELGTDSDANVGRALGLADYVVKRKRRMLGIAAYYPPPHPRLNAFPWTAEAVALLGKMTDHDAARALGVSAAWVNVKRRELGIPAFGGTPRVIQWSEEMLGLLGRVADSEVARRFGVPWAIVKSKRHALGIRAFSDYGAVVPSAALRRLLARPNVEVMRRSGLSEPTVRRLRKSLGVAGPERTKYWSRERLGRAPDARLAAAIARSPQRVRAVPAAPGSVAFVQVRKWQPEEVELVGSAPDAEVARLLGRTPAAVQSKRMELASRRGRA
jgi:hypothetical protein